ncbi:MAG: signal peptidase II [Saccharofermentanales bacterium]|jgi:signal peptidase II|nr:signal peptidase II [Clostridiaceae bacterium]
MAWSIIVIILLASADQLLKVVVRNNISPADSITVIDGFFYLVNRHNPGAAWSFLANKDWGIYVLTAISAAVTLVMIVIIFRSRHVRLQACLTLISAGSVGNLLDRIRYKGVTDYLDFHFGNYIFPTFNLADILIVCGTILLALLILTDHDLVKGGWSCWLKKEKSGDFSVKENTHGSEDSH